MCPAHNGKSGVASVAVLHRSFRCVPGTQRGGPHFGASDTELTLVSARFRAVSQSYVPDPGAPPGNRACWGIMKNDEVSFFHIIPRTCFWVLLYWARMCKRKHENTTYSIIRAHSPTTAIQFAFCESPTSPGDPQNRHSGLEDGPFPAIFSRPSETVRKSSHCNP